MPHTELDFGDEWREVFENAKAVSADPSQPRDIRAFWAAINEGRTDDAAKILDRMEQDEAAAKRSHLHLVHCARTEPWSDTTRQDEPS